MRFSIFEYSQEKLVSLGLDVTDALLLNWFVNFFCGKMEKQIFKEADGTTKIFGWVKTSKIIEDLPVIGITSEKGIRRRFDSFVEKGILDRKTVQTQNGKKSFYKTTAIYDSLINTIAIQKVQEEKKQDESQNSQRNCNGLAEKTNLKTNEENPQRTKMTYAKNEEEITEKELPQRNCDRLAERNENTLAEGNCDRLALNDSLTRNSFINYSVVKNSVAAISALSEKYFGKNAFDVDFPQKAAAFFTKIKIKDTELYFEFIKNKLKEKQESSKVSNPRGFAYSLFFQQDIAQEFMEKQQQILVIKQKEAEKLRIIEDRKITCPCCKNHFLPDFISVCPNCDFPIEDFEDTTKVEIHIKYLKLPEEKQREYQDELNKIFCLTLSSFLQKSPEQYREEEIKRKQQVENLNIKYGLVS